MAVESVAEWPWNGRPDQRGISGRMRVESVAGWAWNTHALLAEAHPAIHRRRPPRGPARQRTPAPCGRRRDDPRSGSSRAVFRGPRWPVQHSAASCLPNRRASNNQYQPGGRLGGGEQVHVTPLAQAPFLGLQQRLDPALPVGSIWILVSYARRSPKRGWRSPLPRIRALCTNSKKPKYSSNFSWEIPRWGRSQERSKDRAAAARSPRWC
jgi:hypothetical protein